MSIPILQEQPSFSSEFSQNLGRGISGGIQGALENFQKQKRMTNLSNVFEQQGYPKDLAQLAAIATTGGQTEILKNLLESRQRGPFIQEEMEATPTKFVEEEDIGLTPKEKIKREEGRFAKQSEKYGELSEKASKLNQEQMRLQRLQELNEKGNLPKNLGRLNVNLKSGELVVPFAASPDAQEFGKIVNDFLAGAKDTFGARVTNFEVNRFLRRLPSLLNTEEGRRRVLRQMEIINQINDLHNQSVLDQFDQAGGIRKIDFDVATRRGRKKVEDQVKELQKEYVTGKQSKEIEESVIAINPKTGEKIYLREGKWSRK